MAYREPFLHEESNIVRVRAVHSPYFQMPFHSRNWEEVVRRLSDLEYQINTGRSPSFEVKYAIKKFDPATEHYNYEALFLVESDQAWKQRLRVLYPKMARIAIRLPELFPQPILLSRRQIPNKITLTQLQVLSLIANAFFCTFPPRQNNFPRNKFCRLFQGDKNPAPKAEKLKLILHYFERMVDRFSTPGAGSGTLITYERRVVRSMPRYEYSVRPLTRIEVLSNGYIEDARGKLQVDFANKLLGGGILGHGATQEEIRFAISPELIAGCFLSEELDGNEAIIITGAERFSKYTGYASTLKYDGDFLDSTGIDAQERRDTAVVAIDALKFASGREWEQFGNVNVDRELTKLYAGYYDIESQTDIATGNWGAGVFNGDQELKFILQWIAASEANRSLSFYTVGRAGQADAITIVVNHIQRSGKVTVGNLYRAIVLYNDEVVANRQQNVISVFNFLTTDPTCQHVLGIN